MKNLLGTSTSSAQPKPLQTLNPLPYPSKIRRPSTSRLWNPSNSTPRVAQPPIPLNPVPAIVRDIPPRPVPLSHPQPSSSRNNRQNNRQDDSPLLTLPEQLAKRSSSVERKSLQIDISNSSSPLISLPGSVSIGLSRKTPSPLALTDSPDSQKDKKRDTGYHKQEQSVTKIADFPLIRDFGAKIVYKGENIGRGHSLQRRGVMETDTHAADANIEAESHRHPCSASRSGFPNINSNASATSLPATSAIGPALSTTSSSAIGSDHGDDLVGAEEAWGPSHPCYPHLNPHVPTNSPLYRTTRIIRIRRDWLLEGDLAPTFSNLYPEILDPAGLSEHEFRKLISHVNSELVPAFNPFAWRNILDSVLGLLTGWVLDDLGATGIKKRLQRVEAWLEDWNMSMEKGAGDGEAVRIVPLRRTGYLNLDIQIPDPVINVADEQSEADTTPQRNIYASRSNRSSARTNE